VATAWTVSAGAGAASRGRAASASWAEPRRCHMGVALPRWVPGAREGWCPWCSRCRPGPSGRPRQPRRWSIAVVLTTTMEHRRGCPRDGRRTAPGASVASGVSGTGAPGAIPGASPPARRRGADQPSGSLTQKSQTHVALTWLRGGSGLRHWRGHGRARLRRSAAAAWIR